MTFDWITFLKAHNITFVDKGKSTTQGNIAIQCPWCGDNDPSQHLGIHLQRGFFNCWRNPNHRGRTPQRLIMRLLGCDLNQANDILSGGLGLNEFDSLAQAFKGEKPTPLSHNTTLTLPELFKPIEDRGRGRAFVNYLVGRGFRREDIGSLCSEYTLRHCTTGVWHNRIIFPVTQNQRLLTWTGRTINPNEDLRYLSLSEKADASPQPALASIKHLVWNYDELTSDHVRVITVVEGPFDALKVDYYGKDNSVRATCLFGTGVTGAQKALLSDLRECCDEMVVIPDSGALSNTMRLLSELCHLNVRLQPLPSGVGDPGELSRDQVLNLLRNPN